MPRRYKVIGSDGSDDNDGRGYSLRRSMEEAEGWMEESEDPTVLIVPLDGPNRTIHSDAARYRDTPYNRAVRERFIPEVLERWARQER